MRYTTLYNHQFPQSALKSKTPIQTMKDWYKTHPHLFHKKPYGRPGCETPCSPSRSAQHNSQRVMQSIPSFD